MTTSVTIPTDSTLEWLVTRAEPWVVYNSRKDLLGQPETAPEVQAAYDALRTHPNIEAILDELQTWPQETRSGGAYQPKDSFWRLTMLGDFGLKRDDARVAAIAEKVFAAQATDPYPPGFLHGGFDHTKAWDKRPYICVSHTMTYALAQFGYLDDPRLQKVYDYIEDWQRNDGGWHPNVDCLPGNSRADDPSCPFGTVNVLRALIANPATRNSTEAQRAADHVLNLWTRRAEPYRPVGFGMGTTFDKMQYPFVQHQLLKTLDTLSWVDAVLGDPRFTEMLAALNAHITPEGRVKADSITKLYSAFDFAQKKEPSPWITFLVARINQRAKAAP